MSSVSRMPNLVTYENNIQGGYINTNTIHRIQQTSSWQTAASASKMDLRRRYLSFANLISLLNSISSWRSSFSFSVASCLGSETATSVARTSRVFFMGGVTSHPRPIRRLSFSCLNLNLFLRDRGRCVGHGFKDKADVSKKQRYSMLYAWSWCAGMVCGIVCGMVWAWHADMILVCWHVWYL